MRILLTNECYPDPRRGSAKVLLHLGSEFKKLGHDVQFIFLDDLPRWARHYRISWFLFPFLVGSRLFAAVRRRLPYDVIDISGGDAWLASALRRWYRLSVTIVCRSHGWEHEDYRVQVRGSAPARWRWARGLLMRLARLPMVTSSVKRADIVLVGSSQGRRFALERGWKAADRVVAIPCGVDEKYFRTEDHSGGRGLLFAGGWLRIKGVQYLAKAYEIISSAGSPIPLSIVGYGRAREEVLQAFDQSLHPGIRMGEALLDEEQMMEEYRSHDVLVFPSLYEGFGMVLLEAMASGLAVVATPVGGAADLIRHEENGIIVPAEDAGLLAKAIIGLWNSPEKRRRLGVAARRTAREYTWGNVARRTLQSYQMVRVPSAESEHVSVSLDRAQ
jgi:glycosyltransferase involved in cell wall biosynthesis